MQIIWTKWKYENIVCNEYFWEDFMCFCLYQWKWGTNLKKNCKVLKVFLFYKSFMSKQRIKNQYIGGNCLKTVYRFKRGLAKRKGVVFLIGAEKGEGWYPNAHCDQVQHDTFNCCSFFTLQIDCWLIIDCWRSRKKVLCFKNVFEINHAETTLWFPYFPFSNKFLFML